MGPHTILCGVTARPAPEMVRRDLLALGQFTFRAFLSTGFAGRGSLALVGSYPGALGRP